jgi:hypothetical protein
MNARSNPDVDPQHIPSFYSDLSAVSLNIKRSISPTKRKNTAAVRHMPYCCMVRDCVHIEYSLGLIYISAPPIQGSSRKFTPTPD